MTGARKAYRQGGKGDAERVNPMPQGSYKDNSHSERVAILAVETVMFQKDNLGLLAHYKLRTAVTLLMKSPQHPSI